MVLFDFDDILKNKYNAYIENNDCESISYNEFKIKGLNIFSNIFPFYFSHISQNYIENILNSNKIKILVSCIDNNFNIKNMTSILIFHKTISLDCIKYYILLLGTHERFRKFGYGKIILDEFIDYIGKSNNTNKKIKILLKSLESSMNFYLSYGFVISELKSNRLFYKYEPTSELKLNQEKILELVIE